MGRLTRRALLRRGVEAGAGLGLVSIIPASALGAAERAAPSNRITMGFIGIGGKGGGALRALLGYQDVQVVAVCDVDRKNRETAKKAVEDRYSADMQGGTYKGCDAYVDFRELCARDDIDAVVISTPDHWHAITVIEAARSGKDIYCEKPLSLTIREGRAMVDAVRRSGRVFQTGSQQRSAGPFRMVCELIRSGRIGTLQEIYVTVGGPSSDCILPAEPIPDGLDWEMWLGPAPYRPFNSQIHPYKWRAFRDYSGGGLTDWGAHHFDISQWALGMDESGPVEITPPDGKDVKYLTYRYANGVKMYHCTDGGKGVFEKLGGNSIRFVGTEGKIEVNRSAYHCWPDSIAKEPLGPNDVFLYRSIGHMEDWVQCMKTRQRPVCDIEIGHRSVTVAHLGNLAYWLKRPIRWDPANEEILGDAEANRWLDRPKRDPWRIA